ncbi:MAG: spermidine/putrescine ABC transporter substrate-binding protein [Kiritimatiellae bacterium]|nr:spermidine/putrescine ABC transporter substrate-binding protein [Kiritimatiellia bacterium]
MMNLFKVSVCVLSAVVVVGCAPSGGEMHDLSPQARAAAAASGCKLDGKDGGELRIYTWSDYIAPELVAGFEKALGVSVVIDTFDSNEAMCDRLKAGGTGYDLMIPSSYIVSKLADEGMIEEIDHSKCPNVRVNFDRSYAAQVADPTFYFSVPYSVTYTGFMYAKDKMPAGADVESWKILENPAMKGRVTLLDDIREVIGGGLMALGYSINSTNPTEIDAAVAQVLKWKGNVRKFDAESYKGEVADGSSWIGHGYSTDAVQVMVCNGKRGTGCRSDIGFALPKEGFTISFDEMVVAKDAKRKDLAYAFINFVYDGEVAKANMEYICGVNPVRPGIDLLDEKTRSIVIITPETLSRGQVLRSIDDPQVMELYNKAWDKIKAADAK